jgi:peptide/nickel transport system permease protein
MKRNKYQWIIDLIIEYAIKLFLLILIVFIFNQILYQYISSGTGGYVREYIEVKEFKYHPAYQFFNYLSDLLRLDLGRDPTNNAPVTFYIGSGLLNSALLFFPSILFSVLISYWIAKSYYMNKRKAVTKIVNDLSIFISSIPIYWLAFTFFLLIIVSDEITENTMLILIISGALVIILTLFYFLNRIKGKGWIKNVTKSIYNINSRLILYWIGFIIFMILVMGGEGSNTIIWFIPPIVFLVIVIKDFIEKFQQYPRSWLIKKLLIRTLVFSFVYGLILYIMPEYGFNIGGTQSWKVYDADFFTQLIDRVWHLLLPWIPMVTLFTVILSQSLKIKIDELKNTDYVKLAKAKGLPKNLIFKKHLSSPIWAELLSKLSSYIPFFITYLVVVEVVFYYHGIGFYCIEKSYPVQNASILFLGIFVIFFQFLNNLLIKTFIPYLRRDTDVNRKSKTNRTIVLIILVIALISFVHNMVTSPPISLTTIDSIIRIGLIVAVFVIILLLIIYQRRKQSIDIQTPSDRLDLNKEIDMSKFEVTIKNLPKPQKPKLTNEKRRALIKFLIGLSIIFVILLIGFLVPIDPKEANFISPEKVSAYVPPMPDYPMGIIDALGVRLDYMSLVFVAGRYLLIPIISALIGLLAGTLLGVVSGLWKSVWDRTMTRFFEFIEMFPSVLLLIIMLTFFGFNISGFMFTLILIGSARIYRVVREEVIILRQEEFIRAVKLLGSNFWNILRKHILPNIRIAFVSNLFTLIADFIILDATLIYITQYTMPDFLINIIPIKGWGLLISSNLNLFVRGELLSVIFPGIFLVLVIGIFRWIGKNSEILVKR